MALKYEQNDKWLQVFILICIDTGYYYFICNKASNREILIKDNK